MPATTGYKRLPRSGVVYFGTIRDGDDVVDGPDAPTGDDGPQLPAKSAKKDEWVHTALNLGLEPGGLNKPAVIKLVEEHVASIENSAAVGGEVADVELGADTEQPGAGPGQGDEA